MRAARRGRLDQARAGRRARRAETAELVPSCSQDISGYFSSAPGGKTDEPTVHPAGRRRLCAAKGDCWFGRRPRDSPGVIRARPEA